MEKIQGNSFWEYRTFVPHKIPKKNYPDSQHYNREVKQLKVKFSREYDKRKLGELSQAELKRLSRTFLAAKKKCTEDFHAVIITEWR